MNRVKLVGFLSGPILFVVVYFILTRSTGLSIEACKVLATASLMVAWWVTEAVHVSVTALIPMVFLPILGIITIREATASYGNPVIFLFMGGFIIALALEKHNLHQRIALNLIKLTGTSGNGVIAGFMLSTGIISMWISNTATAIMMLPIAVSVTRLLSGELSASVVPEKNYRNFATGLMLSIAYAASIGGMTTIIGTPPNVVMTGLYRQTYDTDITFVEWVRVGFPVSVSVLIICYLLITRVIFPNHLKKVEGSAELINQKLKALGRISKAETLVLIVFFITSFCWVFRPYVNEWLSSVFYPTLEPKDILNDTVIAMAGGLLMFSIPISLKSGTFILSWDDTLKLPWGILILFGGGMCLAKSLEDVGLIQEIGASIASQRGVSLWVLVLALAGISMFLTELMSNVALTTIFVPVVFGIADGLGQDPLMLAIPVTFAASCAFSMPVSTPPNAILFASGHIRLKDMMKAGIILNILSLIAIVLLCMLLL